MTWQPGSIGSRRGHVQIAKFYGVKRYSGKGMYRISSLASSILFVPSTYTLPQLVSNKYQGFTNLSGTVYYINGKEVFETDIVASPSVMVIFDPVAKVGSENLREIMFRKMDKLEWLFA